MFSAAIVSINSQTQATEKCGRCRVFLDFAGGADAAGHIGEARGRFGLFLWKVRTVKTRLPFAFGDGQAYGAGGPESIITILANCPTYKCLYS